ncbi:hypothetical protein L873DRAFT_1812213, partial [Choiromyces venosus 120613-1]
FFFRKLRDKATILILLPWVPGYPGSSMGTRQPDVTFICLDDPVLILQGLVLIYLSKLKLESPLPIIKKRFFSGQPTVHILPA